jgi:hypothetical protein
MKRKAAKNFLLVNASASVGTETLTLLSTGLGYLEVNLRIFPLGSRLVSALPIPIGGGWYNFSADFNRP